VRGGGSATVACEQATIIADANSCYVWPGATALLIERLVEVDAFPLWKGDKRIVPGDNEKKDCARANLRISNIFGLYAKCPSATDSRPVSKSKTTRAISGTPFGGSDIWSETSRCHVPRLPDVRRLGVRAERVVSSNTGFVCFMQLKVKPQNERAFAQPGGLKTPEGYFFVLFAT